MKNRIVGTTLLFVATFLPIHVLPPLLSSPFMGSMLGQSGTMLVSLAYHFGFALAGIALLCLRSDWRAAAVRHPARIAVLAALPPLLVLLPAASALSFQLLVRVAGGMLAALMLGGFYQRIKADHAYANLPAIFTLSGLMLESSALLMGWIVNTAGSRAGLLFGASIALMLALALLQSLGNLPLPLATGKSGKSGKSGKAGVAATDKTDFNFSGSLGFMLVAILAYGGFFLMLLLLGTLQAMAQGSLLSGIAIFSTALAFSAGNMLPLHRFRLLRPVANPVRLGCSLSITGSALLWHGYGTGNSIFLLSGVFLVALGNGVTVSRCFQNAVWSSPDGFSAPLLTMIGVMLLAIALTLGGRLLQASAPAIQMLVFVLALMIALGLNPQRQEASA